MKKIYVGMICVATLIFITTSQAFALYYEGGSGGGSSVSMGTKEEGVLPDESRNVRILKGIPGPGSADNIRVRGGVRVVKQV